TCHRGSTRPVTMPTLPQTPPPLPPPTRMLPPPPPPDDLVARYTPPPRDLSPYRLPRTLKGNREGWDGTTTPFEAQMSDGKWHVVSQTPDGRREQIVTSEGGWVKMEKDKGFSKMPDASMEQFQFLANAYEPVSPLSIPKEARIFNTEKIGDHDTVIMTTRLDDTHRQRLFFDTSTGLLIRRQILMRVPVGEVPQQ